ncbi:oxidoreductase [Aestuariibius sp. HNIBRBA575]|uniref:oxidoreductase n=1 Tax=Aestuariibius sp. HNIBRBA575 TaxID=3233343 RepID=UPI0034A36328
MKTWIGALFVWIMSVVGVFAEPGTLIVEFGDQQVSLGLTELDAMPQSSFVTETIWTDGPVEFSGVTLFSILNLGDVEGQTLNMVALNDYAVQMPISDITEDHPIIATRINGAEMQVRDKGPYWIVYPYDRAPEYQTETIYARSIWQLVKLSVMN